MLSVRSEAAMVAITESTPVSGWQLIAGAGVMAALWFGWWLGRRKSTVIPGNQPQLAALIQHADCILWEARVRPSSEELHWDLKFHDTDYSRRFFGGIGLEQQTLLWAELQQPERATIDQIARDAVEGGKPGYEQEFHFVCDGVITWLREQVSITRLSENEYWLVGLVTDVSEKRKAEQARKLSELTVQTILEHADCLLWRASVYRAGNGLRWTDFHLPHSHLFPELFGEVATRSDQLWSMMNVPGLDEMNRRSEMAILGGQAGYEQTFLAISKSGRKFWLHERVSVEPCGADEWNIVGVVTDITAQRKAEEAHSTSETWLTHMVERTNSIFWQSQLVRQPDGQMKWTKFFIPPSRLYDRLFGQQLDANRGFDWRKMGVPEDDEMRVRAEKAMADGVSGYDQVFHIPRLQGDIWLSENVSIQRAGEGEWNLVGIITDITARRQSEHARVESEERLGKLLEYSDCLVWEAEVIKHPDGTIDWAHFMPRSALHRRLFGENAELRLLWHKLDVPELPEMNQRALQAIERHAPEYTQEFRVIEGDKVTWLREFVKIVRQAGNQSRLVGVVTDITAQRRAEVAQRTSELRLHEILMRADCLLWEGVADLRGSNWLWTFKIQPSHLCERLYGSSTPPADVGLWRQFNIPEWQEMNARCRVAMEAGQAGYEQVFHIETADGQQIWIKESVRIQRVDEHRYSLVGVATDITAQRGAEESAHLSAKRYHALFQHTPVAIMEADFSEVARWLDDLRKEGVSDLDQWLEADTRRIETGAAKVRLTSINDTALRMFKAQSETNFKRRRHRLETPESLQVIRDAFVVLWDGKAAGLESEFDMHDLEGGHHRINMRWWIGADKAGRMDLQQTVLVYIDLTELKKTEAELAAEKERLSVTLRAMAEGVITTDIAGRVLYINPAAATLTEWDSELAIGKSVAEICQFTNPRTGKLVEVPVERVSRGDVVVNLPPQTNLGGRQGTHRIVEGCCAPIHSAASKVMGVVLVFRDVTEHERLEQELIRATRLESVGVLAGGIAHDFNNILTAVMGNLALGLLDVPAESPAGVSLRAAEKAATRARDLTQQLLTFAKGGEPVRSAVQLGAIIQEMTTFALHGSPVKAEYTISPKLRPADADKGQIGRVVQNLVINAVQAMPEGGVLKISAENAHLNGLSRPGLSPGDYVLIRIADSGMGISPEHLPRIFDPYFTTKKTGSGLGLAAVYSIVKKHQGHIEVESKVGEGTTFSIWLPALHDKTEQAVTRPPMATTSLTGRVLFMDDDEIIRDMATKLLRRFGLEVVCAQDGSEMVDRYREAMQQGRKFTLVIMDLTVPGGMGGLPALEKLKQLDPEVKAIVSSGYSSDPVLANYRSHGFSAVISKPYDIHDFARVLRDVLGMQTVA